MKINLTISAQEILAASATGLFTDSHILGTTIYIQKTGTKRGPPIQPLMGETGTLQNSTQFWVTNSSPTLHITTAS